MDNDSKLIFENYLNHLKIKNNFINEAVMGIPLITAPILQTLFGVSTLAGLFTLIKDTFAGSKASNLESIIQQIQNISQEGDFESEIGKITNLSQSMISADNEFIQRIGSILNNVISSYSGLIEDESMTTIEKLDKKVDSILIDASNEMASVISAGIKSISTSPQYDNATKLRVKESGEGLLSGIEAFASGVSSKTHPVGRKRAQSSTATASGPQQDPDDEYNKRKKESEAKQSEAKTKQEEAKARISRAEARKKEAEARLSKNKGDAEARAAQARADREIEAGRIQLEKERAVLKKLQAEAEAAEIKTKAAGEAAKAGTESAKWKAKTDKLNYKQRVYEVKGPLWKRVMGWIWKIGLGSVVVIIGYDFMTHKEVKRGELKPKPTPTPTPKPPTAASPSAGQNPNVTDAISQIDTILQGR
jgi:hypothetical protein